MKKFIILFVTLFSIASATGAMADDKKDYEKSYNHLRGVECVEKENLEEAIKFFGKEIEEHPKNYVAWRMLAATYYADDQFGKAIDAVNKGIKLVPKKDKKSLSKCYRLRADINAELGDTVSAIEDYGLAIRISPEEPDYYESRGRLYYEKDQLKESKADFLKMVELSPGDFMGHMYLGCIANLEEDYDLAIEKFSLVMKLDQDYASAWSFRAQSHRLKEEYVEAVDDAITAIKMNYDRKAAYELHETAESAFQLVEAKLKAQEMRDPQDTFWPFMLATIYQDSNDHIKAFEHYLKANSINESPKLLYWAAAEAQQLGDYDTGITLITQAIERDSTNSHLYYSRSDMEDEAGYTEAAIADIDRYIEMNPDLTYGYYTRGWIKDKHGVSDDEAIEDYTMSIALDPKYDYSYLCRGQIYLRQGKEDLARADFENVLKLDTTFTKKLSHTAQYALLYLGRSEEAKAWMDSILVHDDDNGNLYDAACVYSLLGELDTSFYYLKKALEGGFTRFGHIRRDDDLENLHRHPDFEALVTEFEDRHKEFLKGLQINKDERTTEIGSAEIPFTRDRGICKVNCSINGLPLYFVFDTGASDVTLSMVEANFMLKNDYLSMQDLSGTRRYITADGSISEGTIVMLREVNFGGLTMKNVKASIVRNQKAPLLLGQSVLSRLGHIEIDNENRKIVINNIK
jgi:clan AA aspartic protease (TIGR02281 family)